MRSKRFVIGIRILDGVLYAVCMLGLWQIWEKADLPFEVSTPRNGVFEVLTTPKLAAPPLQTGDEIVAFDGQKLRSLEELEFLTDGKRVGDEMTLTVAGASAEVSVRLVHDYTLTYLLSAWLIGTLFFLSGALVFSKRQDDLAAVVYHFGAVSVGVVIMSTWGCYALRPEGIGQLVRGIFSIAYAFVPALFLHFSLIFPSRRQNILTGYEFIPYLIAGFLSVSLAVTFVAATMPFSMTGFYTFLAIFNVTRWFYAASVVLAVLIFVRSYRLAREEIERRKLRWIMLGLAISSLGFIGLWQIPQLLTSRGLVREEVIVLLSGATPVAFSVAIVKYHVLDIDHLFNRSTVYVMMLVILLSLYAMIVGVLAAVVGSFTVTKSIAASAAAAVAVAVLFEPIRRRVQVFVDKNFFRVRYDMRKVEKSFSDKLKGCVSVGDVAELSVKTAVEAIPVDRIGYFLFEEDSARLRVAANRGFDMLESRSVSFDLENFRNAVSLPIAIESKIEPGVNFERADTEVFRRWGINVAFPARSEAGKLLSFLALGPKKSGLRFSIEDVDLLSFISVNSASAHERIMLQNRLAFEREERERLEEINRMKTYFVASVSHDLKTPLTTIRMYTEALKEGRKFPTSKVRDYLNAIQGESKRLTRMIENVLSVAKTERGSVAYSMKPESLDEIVSDAVALMNYEVVKGECKLTARLDLKKKKIMADRDSVVEALGNLIANAVEYSPKKKSIVVRTFSKNGCVCVSVKDSGIGIAKDDMERIFEPFYRGKASARIRPGGTGLGLSVVKNVMDAHHGQIEIESEPGHGTRITLLFPIMEKK